MSTTDHDVVNAHLEDVILNLLVAITAHEEEERATLIGNARQMILLVDGHMKNLGPLPPLRS